MIIFENEEVKLDVNDKDETVWLSQQQMEKLFNFSRTNIIDHIIILIRMENLIKFQYVRISDKFEKRYRRGNKKYRKIF